MRVCTGCVYQRLPPFKLALAPAGGMMLNFGLFAAVVCVQVMCWVLGVTQKMSAAMAEAMTMSNTCVRGRVACASSVSMHCNQHLALSDLRPFEPHTRALTRIYHTDTHTARRSRLSPR